MRNKLIFISYMLIALGCTSTKTVTFKVNDKGKEFRYRMKIPKGYTLKEMDFENERAKIFLYPDSSRLFFSDNIRPSAFYPDAYKKYGNDINLQFLSADTMTINGTDGEGKFWKERKAKNVVYGYMKVPLEKKEKFDSILNKIYY